VTNVSHSSDSLADARPRRPALALFEPEIAANVAAMIRLAACLSVELHIVEPTGFVFDRARMRRVALDHLDRARPIRHASFAAFDDWRAGAGRRLVLLTTAASSDHLALTYRSGDLLMVGRESGGASPEVHARADHRVRIPIAPGTRSLNVVTAAAIVLAEALRQQEAFPSVARR
jgi:tRNA (cytidine/uridine-2'-O-)-methyltransferase